MGVVHEVGAQVVGVTPGDRVYVNPGRSCGACHACGSGTPQKCQYWTLGGYYLGTSYAAAKKHDPLAGKSLIVNGATGTLGVGVTLATLALGASRVFAVARGVPLLECGKSPRTVSRSSPTGRVVPRHG
ncbi:alcohol dehydrogenase catalytic domain-containing protein [Streptomyces sp. NPDC046909]|uniref:alcohol dehydrogenase catalytic domain-containing protein n=1 Tax=Streptomyces sp. NPDC046909 TaxID=3155617 RepID=UPI0034047FBC